MRIPSEHKIPGRFAPIFLWKKEDNYVKIKNKELYMCNICARCSKTMLVFWEILLSLSARRVWIEIDSQTELTPYPMVTLREEGVD